MYFSAFENLSKLIFFLKFKKLEFKKIKNKSTTFIFPSNCFFFFSIESHLTVVKEFAYVG